MLIVRAETAGTSLLGECLNRAKNGRKPSRLVFPLRPFSQDVTCSHAANLNPVAAGEKEFANNRRGLQLFTNSKGTSSQVSSTSNSPDKTRPKLATEEDVHTEVSPSQLLLDRDTEIHNPISAFPTLNQSVMDSKLKEMLLSVQRLHPL